MAVNNKPDHINNVWASDGDKVYPGDSKTALGWIEEIPPHEYFNYIINKQDAFIAHVNQLGLPSWDTTTEYIGGQSLTVGSDGVVYRAIIDNIGQDPSVPDGGYWEPIPLGVSDPVSLKRYVGYELYSSNFTAQVNRRYYGTTPLTITLPTEHAAGDVVTVSKSPTVVVRIEAVGCNIITSLGTDTDVDFDLNDEVNIVSNGTDWEV